LLLPGTQMARVTRLAALPPAEPGTEPHIALVAELPSGQAVFATTTWAQFYQAFMTLAQRLGPPLLEEEEVPTHERQRNQQ
jgi:hypothetical protein